MKRIPGAEGVEVASVDSFQGREEDAVVISMVRSNRLAVTVRVSYDCMTVTGAAGARLFVDRVIDGTEYQEKSENGRPGHNWYYRFLEK